MSMDASGILLVFLLCTVGCPLKLGVSTREERPENDRVATLVNGRQADIFQWLCRLNAIKA
jgi:hypothetical protein